MRIERKIINPKERIYYFNQSFPLWGCCCRADESVLLKNIYDLDMAQELLLTADFLYIKSKDEESFDDLEAMALAEIDDYLNSNPQKIEAQSLYVEDKIKMLLRVVVAPFLQHDGGDIEFVSYQNEVLQVRFLGKCQGCPYAQRTLTERVAKNLMRYLPQIRDVGLVK